MEFPLCGKHCVRYFTQELTHLGPEGIGIRVLMLQIKKKTTTTEPHKLAPLSTRQVAETRFMRDQICSTPNFMFFTQQVCHAKTKTRILTIPWHSHPFALWRHSRNTLKLNSYISYVGRSRWKTLFPIVRVQAMASQRTQALPPLCPPHPSSDSALLLRSDLLPATEQDWLQKTLSPRALWAPYSWTTTFPLSPGQMPTI